MYGDAFIAGYTDGCSFDVKIERAMRDGQSKREIEFDLKVDYGGIFDLNVNQSTLEN